MFVLTVGLIIAVILLWSRIKQLDQRIEALESDSRRAAIQPAAVEPASQLTADAKPAPTPPVSTAIKPRTVTIVNRPPQRSLVEEPEPAPVEVTSELAAPSSPAPSAIQPRTMGFEELFGTKLPIWGGGITLAVAGLFIVKYSIDAGLLSPAIRVVLGLLFAMALVAGAEVARRWKQTAIDPRISQALAGAGVATAYASILIATNLYGLISPAAGFVGLALTTGAALALALRFGSPAAVLGLVGGLAAPALVGESTGNIAPLTAYLALVIGGIAGIGHKQRWMWLTAAALIGGFGWGLVLVALEMMDTRNVAALASYTLLLAFALPMLLGDFAHERLLKAGAAILGAVQIGLIVKQGGYGALEWGFYGLLSIGAIVLARIDRKLTMLPPVALGIGLVTMLGWSNPGGTMLALVAGGGVLLFAGSALADIWTSRGTLRDPIQASVALGGALIVSAIIAPTGLLSDRQWSLLALAAALPLAISAAIGAHRALPHRDPRFLVLGIGAAALASLSVPDLADRLAWPAIFAAGVAILVELWRRRPDLDYRGAIGVLLLATAASIAESFARWLGGSLLTLAGEPLYISRLPSMSRALSDLIAPGVILTLAAWRSGNLLPPLIGRVAFAACGLLGVAGLFVLYKQVFAISDGAAFKDHGMLERVILDQILFAAGWAAIIWRDRIKGLRELGLAMTGIAVARVLLYHVLLFNPLLRIQLVGAVPLANLLAPAYLLPLAWIWQVSKAEPMLTGKLRLPVIGTQMVLIGIYVATSLRQIFHGSLLAAGGVSQAEDIGRSLAAIVVAICFLRWGIYKRERPWRIASLVLMLVAIAKVFAVDTSGLEGLVRIASFVALGFSLIGIGWLYSRHLRSDEPQPDQPADQAA